MPIRIDIADQVAHVTMDRPERHNALDLAHLDDLATAWERCEVDDEVRVVVLTGAGDDAFSAGADLKDFAPPGAQVEPRHDGFFPKLTKPLIAAVNGLAYGGGTELLGATDIRVAADHATFALPEARWGLFAGGGSPARFVRQLPWPLAMDLLLTGRAVAADEALRWGLVNAVVPRDQLMTKVDEYVDLLLRGSPRALRALKEYCRSTFALPLDEAFAAALPYVERAAASDDAREGLAAFAEKRAPRWAPKRQP